MSILQAAKEMILGSNKNSEELNKLRLAAKYSEPGEQFYINTNEKPSSTTYSPKANQVMEQKLYSQL